MSAKKKVIFCTYSSIYSSIVLEQLVADSEIDVVAIVNSTRVLRPSLSPIQGAISQLKISGFRYSVYLFFITDFFKWMQPFSVLRKFPLRHVNALAKLHKIPIIDTRDINTMQAIDFIKKHNANFLLCAHFNQLLKEPVFAIERMECLNIHPSLLPSYKGVDPVFFAMRDNAEEIGVTLHKIDENFDSGDILLQSSMKTDKTKSLLFNNCQLFEKGVNLALTWMKNENFINKPKINNKNNNTSYDSWPSSVDVVNFKKSGKKLMHLSSLWKKR